MAGEHTKTDCTDTNKNYNQFVSVEFASQDRKDMRYIAASKDIS